MRERVERDTYMAKSAARRCINFLKAGLPFTLEHPGTQLPGNSRSGKNLSLLTEIAISLSLGPEIAISLSLGPEIAISPVSLL